jgi:hypothetical protein
MGWAALSNGELLAEAASSFDVLITTDQNLPYQQNLTGLSLAVLMLPTTSWPRRRMHLEEIATAVDAISPGAVHRLEFANR